MIFLIEYDRNQGRIVTIKSFEDSDGEKAEVLRLELELRLGQQHIDNEVVLLEAATERALRLTHRRYFEDLSELTTSPSLS